MFASWEENSSWTITSPSSCFHFCCFEGWAGSGCSRLLQHPTPHAACQHAGLLLCVCSVYFLQWMCIASHRLVGTARVLRRADEWLSCRDICQTSVTALSRCDAEGSQLWIAHSQPKLLMSITKWHYFAPLVSTKKWITEPFSIATPGYIWIKRLTLLYHTHQHCVKFRHFFILHIYADT